jgi:FkbM family methyltransferase
MYPPSFLDVNRGVTEKYLNYRDGFFIEVGGADGYTQSNTWHLEQELGWKGVLVEPNNEAFEICRENRPNSKVFNAALISHDNPIKEITMMHRRVYSEDPGLMTSVKYSPIWDNPAWSAKASALDEEEIRYEFLVPACTLDSLLEPLDIKTIDFFSLDVEGFELEVLKGFSIEKYLPKVLLVEWHDDIQKIIDVVDNTHAFAEKLSPHDYVFTLRRE